MEKNQRNGSFKMIHKRNEKRQTCPSLPWSKLYKAVFTGQISSTFLYIETNGIITFKQFKDTRVSFLQYIYG